LRAALLLLIALAVAVGPSAAWAQAFAVVVEAAEPGPGGQLRPLRPDQRTGAALARLPDGSAPVALGPGVELPVGAVITTTRARLVLRLPDDEHLHIGEATELTLAPERSVLQRAGEVYYRVRSAFSVQVGAVETAVEGTRFLVVGADGGPVQVSVDEGRVVVRTPEGAQAVGRGQTLTASPGAAPPAPAKWGAVDRGDALQHTLSAGPPRLLLALAAGGAGAGAIGGRAESGVFLGALRGTASLRVAGPLRLSLQPGAGLGPAARQLGGDLVAELQLGPFAVGGGPSLVHERRALSCGGEQIWLHIGGVASGRAALPLGRHLRVLAQGRVGLAGTPFGELGVGLGVAL
jgi:hypothetical protein